MKHIFNTIKSLLQKLSSVGNTQPTNQNSPYVMLGFKGRKDFENQINREVWQLYVNSFEKNIESNAVRHIICSIVNGETDNGKSKKATRKIKEIEKQLENLTNNKKTHKAKAKIIEILSKKVDPKAAFAQLKEMKEQAENYLQEFHFQDKNVKVFRLSSAAIIEEVQNYISLLEESVAVNKQAKIETFLLNKAKSLIKKYPNLSYKINYAMSLLSKCRVEPFNGALKIITPSFIEVSYAHNLRFNNSQILQQDSEKVDKLIQSVTQSMNEINKNKESIFRCINDQNAAIEEGRSFKYRASYCQRKADIYQKMIDEYQVKIDECIKPIKEIFDSLSQKTKTFNDMAKFESMMNDLRTKHTGDFIRECKQNGEYEFLTCLANTSNNISAQLYVSHSPKTELSQTEFGQHKDCVMSTAV